MNTRLFYIASLVLFSGTSIFAQQTLFVKPGSKGDGTSWEKAIGDVQTALRKAHAGTQIWVAEGLYTPTSGTDRSISFVIPSGVKLFGGFAGNEKTVAERNIEAHPTILSGNIGSNDVHDNSYNVIYTNFVSADTRVDGFIISEGYADGNAKTSNRQRSGGGWFNDGANKGKSNPTIANCIFIDNFAKDGGAFYNLGKNGEARPTFIQCVFDSNSSDLDGGAVYCDARENGKANATFENCKFKENKGNYGGSIFCYGLHGEAFPVLKQCMFVENNAYVKGGALFVMSEKMLERKIFATTHFANNSALDHDSDDVHFYHIPEIQKAAN